MSPVAPDAVVVISQVRLQNDQGNRPEELQSSNAPFSVPKPVVNFYKGEPEVLGTTQIFAGILLISIGIPMTIINTDMHFFELVFISGINFWSGILFIVSGSLSVAASLKPTLGKVQSSLVMNIFSSLAAISGMILAVLDLCFLRIFHGPRNSYCAYYKSDIQEQCLGAFLPMTVYDGLAAFILMLFILIFCITISTSVFACRTVCRSSFHENIVVIYQTTSLNTSDATRDVPLDSTAALMSDLKAQT